jgi:hypothetical protein
LIETDYYYIKIIIPLILKNLNIYQIVNYKIENNELKIYFNYNEIICPKITKNTCLIYNFPENFKVIIKLSKLYNIDCVNIIDKKILIRYNLDSNVIINMFMTLPKIINIDKFNKYTIEENKFILFFNK